MSLLQRGADTFYAFRFLKLLVTPWRDTEAFKIGVIDENGTRLKKPTTPEEKSAYTYFHRLVFNIKRLMEKVPFGKTRLASFAAALYLIKEHTGMSDRGVKKILSKLDYENALTENAWFLDEQKRLCAGKYTLARNAPIISTGDDLALKGSSVFVESSTSPVGYIAGVPIFYVTHCVTKQRVAITLDDITR